MSERAEPPTLSHFAAFRLGEAFWSLPGAGRREALHRFLADLEQAVPRLCLYQVYPARGEIDLLAWSAAPVEDPAVPEELFGRLGRAVHAHRPAIEPGLSLWGLTRPSPYARRGSERAIDAVGGEREPYLVVYPFVKTAEWYLLDGEERQRLMNEHIRVGRRFAGVRQLLLYSFGLQDQDFVVVYEMADLARFSELVQELRGTEARRFTARDTPVLTALHRTPEEIVELVA